MLFCFCFRISICNSSLSTYRRQSLVHIHQVSLLFLGPNSEVDSTIKLIGIWKKICDYFDFDLFRSLNSSMLYIQNSAVATIIIIITTHAEIGRSYPMANNFIKLFIQLCIIEKISLFKYIKPSLYS